jgi:hypothetical protein
VHSIVKVLDIDGVNRETPMPDGKPSEERKRQLLQEMFPGPSPSLRARLRRRKEEETIPNLATYDDADAWARSHRVRIPTDAKWVQKIDLRLSVSSLPIVAQLLGSADMSLVTTASFALRYNGARISKDATSVSGSSFYRVTLPDGNEVMVAVRLT